MKRLILIVFLLSIVSVTAQESPINFTEIPDLNGTTGTNNDLIDLDDYYTAENLEYKFKEGSKGLAGITIDIDSNNRLDLTANNPGEFSIIFIGDNDTDDKESNDVNIEITGNPISIETYSFSPNVETLTLKEDEDQTFSVSGSQASTTQWKVDDISINNTGQSYIFIAEEIGTYQISAEVEDTTKTWIVSVIANIVIEQPTPEASEPVCGNGVRETGENCANCPSDVQCGGDSTCQQGICTVETSFVNSISLPLMGLAGGIVLILILVVVLHKTGVFSKIKNKLPKKEKLEEKKEIKPQEPDPLLPLINYFKSNLKKYKEEDLKKQAIQQGWTQQQVEGALIKLKQLQNNPS